MSGYSLNTSATLQCPHGGSVRIVSSNIQTNADSSPMALASDTYTVSGCPFQIPAGVPIPSPCIQVMWLVPDTRVKVNGTPTLSQSSSGMCISIYGVPQGPVVVINTQARAQSQ